MAPHSSSGSNSLPVCHRHAVSYLIRHGALHGFDDTSPQRKTLRARASFAAIASCDAAADAQLQRLGADKIRRLSLTATALATFLKRASPAACRRPPRRAAGGYLCDPNLARLWKRSTSASAASARHSWGLCPPPEGAAAATRPLAAQILAHLHDAFPNADCPIAAFQMTLNAFFLWNG